MKLETFFEKFDLFAEAPDAVARMREVVLELAVRGKLVHQVPADESAHLLLERIKKTKERLIAERRIKRQAILPVYEEEPPFFIPESWKWTRLGEIGDWGSGSTPPRGNPELYDGGITWLKSGELNDNQSLADSEETVSELALKTCSFRRNAPGDILLAMYGATIGKVAILAGPAVTNQAVCGCTAFDGVLNRYLFIFLLSQRSSFHSASEGGAQPNISKVKIVGFPFPLPPFAEQKRIVAKVDELMALCDQLEAQQQQRQARHAALVQASLARFTQDPTPANLQLLFHPSYTVSPADLRKTILTLAMQGRLVPQDNKEEPASAQLERIEILKAARNRSTRTKQKVAKEDDDGELISALPPGWAMTKLANLVTVLNGRAYAKEEFLTEGTPVLRVGNLFTNNHWYYSNLVLESDKYCDTGDLIFAWSASFGPFIWKGPKVIYHYHIWKLESHSEADIFKKFLFWFLQKQTEEIKRAGHGVSMVHMTKEKMEKLSVMLPPLAEQRRIVAKVEELLALVDELETQLVASRTVAQNLLAALVRELTTTP